MNLSCGTERNFAFTQPLRPPAGVREVPSASEDSVLDATGTSSGSGLDEASALRAQLAALNEKFKELEARQAAQPVLSQSTDAASKDTEGVQNDLALNAIEQPAVPVEPVAEPPAPTLEETEVPPASENRKGVDDDSENRKGVDDDEYDDDYQELEDINGVLTQDVVRSPPPDEDVDQEEADLIDLDDDADYNALSDVSDREELEGQEEAELDIFEDEELPEGRSSTPFPEELAPSDSEDVSILSVSVTDDIGADRMERMLRASEEIQGIPPSAPRASRDPRVLASSARANAAAAAATVSKAPKSRMDKGRPPASSTNRRSPSPRNLPTGDMTQSKPAPVPKAPSKVVSEPVPPTSSPSLATGDVIHQDAEPVAQEQAAGPSAVPDRSSLFFIPEKFKGLIRIEPTSSRMVQDEREWRLAEDHLLSTTVNEKGEKEWRFLKGFESDGVFYSLVLPYESLEERWVSGKRQVALQPSAREIPAAERAFASLKTPPRPSIFEAEERKLRRKRILTFADVENQNCASAMGWSGISEDQKGVVVKELPIELREVLEGTRPARPASPPVSFSFEGTKDTESEGFHKAAYGDLGKSLNDYLE